MENKNNKLLETLTESQIKQLQDLMNMDYLIRDIGNMFYQMTGLIHKHPNIINDVDLTKISVSANALAVECHSEFTKVINAIKETQSDK